MIQLNRLSWRKYIKQPNPVATALMAKMKIAAGDRPKVKLQCLCLLLTLRLAPARAELIFQFVDRYLRLNTEEQRQYDQALAKLPEMEKEQEMELVSRWRLEGRQEGRVEGKEELLIAQITRRFGTSSTNLQTQLQNLSANQLDELGFAVFDFKTLTDVEHWLAKQN